MYYVYVIKSINYPRIYIGISTNPNKRLIEHNKGETKSTKYYCPYKIIYQEKHSNRLSARKREIELKKSCNREWIKKQLLGP